MAEQNIASRTVSNVVNAHYGWYIVAMGTMLQLTTNFVSQAYSILIVVMEDSFGWSLTVTALAYSLRAVIGALLSPWAGVMGDRYGAKRVMLIGAGFFTAGLVLLSTITEIWQLFLYYSIILGIAQAMFRVNIPTTVAAWFKQKLGVAVGIHPGPRTHDSVDPNRLANSVYSHWHSGWSHRFWFVGLLPQ